MFAGNVELPPGLQSTHVCKYTCVRMNVCTYVRIYVYVFLQHYISMFGSTISVPLILAPALCIPPDYIILLYAILYHALLLSSL